MMELFLAQWGTWYALRAADMLRLPANIGSRATPDFAQRPTPPRTPDALPTSTHHNSANMGLISKAIKAIRLRELRDNILASKYAAKYSVDQTTLRRR
jgi:hypothetical protein